MGFFREEVEQLYMNGVFPPELFLTEQTSITLKEVDELKEKNPERFYRYYLFLIERKKAEMREIDKIKEENLGQGSPEIIQLMEKLPEDFVSEVGEDEDG